MSNTTSITTETKTTTTEIKLRDDLVARREQLLPLWVGDKSGSLVLPAEAAFIGAPEGVTPESYLVHKKHFDLFENASASSGAIKSVELFKENPELQTITATAPIHGKDSFEATFKRNGTSRNPATGDVTNYVGSIGVARINVVSTRSKAESQAIKAEFRSLAETAGL